MYDLNKLASWFQLCSSKYLGPVRFRILLDLFNDKVASVFNLSDDELIAISGISKQVVKGIREQEDKYHYSFEFMEKQVELANKCNGGIITLDNPNYPEFLKKSSMCHPILYYKGKIRNFLNYSKSIGIVGSRKSINQSIKIAGDTATHLAKNHWVVVSGLALGIDSVAHKSALEAGGLTIAVLGCGPDIVYPSDSRNIYEKISEKGLIISEFPFGSKIDDWKLQKRNKTIVAASLAVFVVQSSEKGGAMNAVKACIEQKKKNIHYTTNL
jgi:DNA processing protein